MSTQNDLELTLRQIKDSLTVEQGGDELYYLQDKSGYVGNSVLWWRKNCAGYTTDVSEAHVFTKEEAERQHRSRDTDIPWPKSYIDSKTRPVVDHQSIKLSDAAIANRRGGE